MAVGSCIVAGYNNSWCLSGHCLGSPSSRSYCHCDANCRLFENCCSDIAKDCQEQGETLMKYNNNNKIIYTNHFRTYRVHHDCKSELHSQD